ncbi:hypothetical protein [Streptomyces hiroshimensis]|nr:hypothetical protein [Streptomyces hiroshimensis]
MVILAAALIHLAVHAARRLRGGHRPRLASPKPLALVSLAALSSAFLIFSYAEGTYSPGLWGDKTCMFTMGDRDHPDSSSLFPLSTVCNGVEIVPAWVNPTLVALTALAAATLVAVPFAYVVRRRTVSP